MKPSLSEENFGENPSSVNQQAYRKALGPETFLFPIIFLAFFTPFVLKMGLVNTLNTVMNTAYDLLLHTVFYLTAICVVMGAISALFSEFGLVTLADRMLRPLMRPVWGLPGAASLAVITTFLSDNPAVLTLAEDEYYRRFFKKYQFPALTNLGTSFGMGLIVCTYMLSMSGTTGENYGTAVLAGLLGAVIGSIISTRLMLRFTSKIYGQTQGMDASSEGNVRFDLRPVRSGSIFQRILGAILEGGKSGVREGVEIIPGVLIICTLVMMLTNGPGEGGQYTGAAYQGIGLLPYVADRLSFILTPLFGFTSAECISVPITALGAAGAAIGLVPKLLSQGLANANDIAIFTAMCMCWSGYLSTHVSMMGALKSEQLTGKAILSHTIGGALAGISAHFIYLALASLL